MRNSIQTTDLAVSVTRYPYKAHRERNLALRVQGRVRIYRITVQDRCVFADLQSVNRNAARRTPAQLLADKARWTVHHKPCLAKGRPVPCLQPPNATSPAAYSPARGSAPGTQSTW